MNDGIKIVIADDHPIFREGLKKVIQSKKNRIIVGEAGDGLEALKLIIGHKPDISIIDIEMPELNGYEVVKKIRESGFEAKVIFLTMHNSEDLFDEAMKLEVKGFVLKENAATDISDAIDHVGRGGHYISPQVSEHLVARQEFSLNVNPVRLILHKLTQTERKILKLISDQKTSNEIAAQLFISPATVETHRSHITAKLNLHGQNSLLKFAIDNKDLI